MVKTLKDFRVYVLHSHVIAYVPNLVVKYILTQPNPDGKRGKWIVFLLEYDLEIKPTKLVKGHRLAPLMAQSNYDIWGINSLTISLEETHDQESNLQVSQEFLSSHSYKYIIIVLQHLQAPVGMDKTRERFIKLKSIKFCILDGFLY